MKKKYQNENLKKYKSRPTGGSVEGGQYSRRWRVRRRRGYRKAQVALGQVCEWRRGLHFVSSTFSGMTLTWFEWHSISLLFLVEIFRFYEWNTSYAGNTYYAGPTFRPQRTLLTSFSEASAVLLCTLNTQPGHCKIHIDSQTHKFIDDVLLFVIYH
jgi:hypothetical protein